MRSACFMLFVIILITLFVPTLFFYPIDVLAAESCTASVSPQSVTESTSSSFSFTVTNTGDVDIIYVKVTRPSDKYSLYNNGGVPAPWIAGVSSSQAEIYNDAIGPGETFNFTLGANIGGVEASNNWTIETIASGPLVGCTGGPFSTEIVSAGDTTPPTISGISVSEITTVSAVVSWTTDELSTSKVNYGFEYAGPQSESSSSLTTSHSVTLTQSIAAGTTYSYSVCSTDSSNNEACSSESSFTTVSIAVATATPTPTSAPGTTATPTPTVTGTGTPTPTPTPTIEKTPPKVQVTTDVSTPFEEAPTVEGAATDNVGVESVDYSTDGGVNWLPVDTLEEPGAKSTTFSFVPYIFDDGNYEIVVRAKDAAGNTGTSETLTLVLDRLPPSVGGVLLSLGPQPLQPDENGVVVSLSSLDIKITLSSVGGAISVDLYANRNNDNSSENKFSLSRSTETGLWSGTINLADPGLYELTTEAIDGAGNKTNRTLGRVLIVEPGEIAATDTQEPVSGGRITLFVKDQLTGLWSTWDGRPFGQDNPQNLTGEGTYQYFIPPGKYYLQVKSTGYQTLTSVIFSLNKSSPLNADFELTHAKEMVILGMHFAWPDFFAEKAPVTLKTQKVEGEVKNIGDEAEVFVLPTTSGDEFDLSKHRGKPFVVSFVSTWSPPALEQIKVVDQLINDDLFPGTMVINQETLSRAQVFRSKGKYKSDIVVDRDGKLVESYNFSFLPTHYFLDRRGVTSEIVTGVLNKDEMNRHLEEVGGGLQN